MEKIMFESRKRATLESILAEKKIQGALCAKLDNRLRELSYVVPDDDPHSLEPLDFNDSEACKVYDASLRYLVAMACARVFPDLDCIISYGVSKSIFLTFRDKGTKRIKTPDSKMRAALEDTMKEIVSSDLPIVRETITKKEAEDLYSRAGWADKCEALRYRPEETVHIYRCDGYVDYPYSYMVPRTSYLKQYRLLFVTPGFILSYPRSEDGGKISPLENDVSFGKALKRYSDWAKTAGVATIASINRVIEEFGPTDLIEMCEDWCDEQMSKLCALYKSRSRDCRLIFISGPSSSGKTTFAKRLCSYLMSFGLRPLRISMDDYYRNRDEIPDGPDGKKDIEGISAIDLDRFNADMKSLAKGAPTEVPAFDFISQRRVKGRILTPVPGSPIIVEGIHGLNPKITDSLDRKIWLGVYISPQVQVSIDNHNPMSLTDARLIRRLVRDHLFRGSSAENTIETWPDVRKGEYQNIYPYQDNADFVFNSYLSYELCVLKKHAVPLLKAIPGTSPCFITANRLLKFIKHFSDIKDELVPCNSLLKEFIGGSSYAD